jgi:hypothetical protein
LISKHTYSTSSVQRICELTPGRPRHRWEDNIRMELREMGWTTVCNWLRIETGGGLFENGNEPSGSTKRREFLDRVAISFSRMTALWS